MVNPILSMMMGRNNPLTTLSNLKQMLNGQSPQALFNMMMQSNPQFAEFVRQNQGKSPDLLCKEYGIDLKDIESLFR